MHQIARAVSPPLPPDPQKHSQQASPPRRNSLGETQSQRSNTSSQHGSRAPSRTRPIILQPQPIRQAVDKAIDRSIDQAPVDLHLDPAFIARVTEAVVKELNNAGVSSASPPSMPPLPSTSQDEAHSPTLSSTTSIPSRYTPPSPERERAKLARVDIGSPEPTILETSSDEQRDSVTTGASRMESKPASNSRARRSSRAGSGSEPSVRPHRESMTQQRPGSIATSPTSDESDDMTPLEKVWQPLFDKNGNPLPRLGSFLRGLALHLIDDYKPKGSLVITPAKMWRFFEETRLEDEQYPWQVIFDSQISSSSLSTLYRRLHAQHHLVQTANSDAPTVPALTPWGFESFMTCLIQAHPELEFQRLNQVVTHMPVSSADDRKERFPKELSRRLLPVKANITAAQRLTASMAHEPRIQLKNPSMMPPPPPPQQQGQQQQQQQQQQATSPAVKVPERERQPYSRRSHSNAFEDDDLTVPSSIPERERKPYTAREYGGKVHENGAEWDRPQGRAEESMPPRPARQNSGSSYSASDPRNIPSSRSRVPVGPGTNPPVAFHNNNNLTRSGRRSPPLGYSRSEVGSASEYPPTQTAPRAASVIDDDERRSRRRTLPSVPMPTNDNDPRGKPIPGRGSIGQGSFDSGYGSAGMPPPLPPLGTSFPSQRSNQPPQYDERRRSAYSAEPGSVGTDGWGSLANGQAQQSYGSDTGR